MFGALVNWVERKEALDRVIASTVDNGEIVRTRPLCVYPRSAHYDDEGDTDSAANFTCERNDR